jgi:hypothetical protein
MLLVKIQRQDGVFRFAITTRLDRIRLGPNHEPIDMRRCMHGFKLPDLGIDVLGSSGLIDLHARRRLPLHCDHFSVNFERRVTAFSTLLIYL